MVLLIIFSSLLRIKLPLVQVFVIWMTDVFLCQGRMLLAQKTRFAPVISDANAYPGNEGLFLLLGKSKPQSSCQPSASIALVN